MALIIWFLALVAAGEYWRISSDPSCASTVRSANLSDRSNFALA